MNKINAKRFKSIYSILLSVVVILIGALFIYHLLNIYLTGINDIQIYTKEKVVAHLINMIIPLVILVILIILGEVFYKIIEVKNPNFKNSSIEFVKGYLKEIDLKNYSNDVEKEINEIKNYEKKRYIGLLIALLPCIATCVIGFIYLLDLNNFNRADPNGSIIKMALYFIPLLLIFFLSLIGYSYYEEAISKIELKYILKVVAYNRKHKIVKNSKKTKFYKIVENKVNILRLVVLVTSITFIVVGLINGENQDVLKKAIMICTECIGLG